MASLIATICPKGIIGQYRFDNYKNLITNNVIIMSEDVIEYFEENNFNTINIVVSRKTKKDFYTFVYLFKAYQFALKFNKPIFFIGNNKIIKNAFEMNLIDKMYITLLNYYINGDIYFDSGLIKNFSVIDVEYFKENSKNYSHVVLEKKNKNFENFYK